MFCPSCGYYESSDGRELGRVTKGAGRADTTAKELGAMRLLTPLKDARYLEKIFYKDIWVCILYRETQTVFFFFQIKSMGASNALWNYLDRIIFDTEYTNNVEPGYPVGYYVH